ncbi:hypothetical protein HaLaN_10462, partial [Haematococcus lacustris]
GHTGNSPNQPARSFHAESRRSDGSDARILVARPGLTLQNRWTPLQPNYTQGHMTMDPDSMAAAAQQLEAIQAAIAAANAPLGDQASAP